MDLVSQAVMARMGGGPGGGGPVAIPLANRASLGMPSLDIGTTCTGSDGTTGTLTNYVTLLDFPGAVNRLRIIFGKRNAAGVVVYPVLPVTQGSSLGYGMLKLLTFPKGVVTICGANAKVPVLVAAASTWTCTTPIMSVGSTTAGNDATLLTTEQDIIPAATIKLLTYSTTATSLATEPEVVSASAMSGSLTATATAAEIAKRTGIFVNAGPPAIAALLDNSGGASGVTLANGTIAATTGTLTTFSTGATVLATHQNDIATLAGQIEVIRQRTEGLQGQRFDGTSTALSVWLNFAVNSDPGAAACTGIQLGYIASGSEQKRRPGYLDIDYIYRGGYVSAGAVLDVPPAYLK